MSPAGDEREARERIDQLLNAAGWSVCDVKQANVSEHRGVAIREFPLPGQGYADYLLYVDSEAAGVVEAKKQGATLTGVETQSAKYTSGLPESLPAWERPLPFAYESTGVETRFTNALDPTPRSRPVFAFHQPETLARWLEIPDPTEVADSEGKYQITGRTFLAQTLQMAELIEKELLSPQKKAIRNLEQSLRANRPRQEHCRDRPQGDRQGQRLRPEDNLSHQQTAQRPDQRAPYPPDAAHRELAGEQTFNSVLAKME